MRHAVDISETMESATEKIEAKSAVSYYFQLFLRFVGHSQWWRCRW